MNANGVPMRHSSYCRNQPGAKRQLLSPLCVSGGLQTAQNLVLKFLQSNAALSSVTYASTGWTIS